MLPVNWPQALRWALMLWLLSWGTSQLGVSLGENLTKGEGYPAPGQVSTDLFRFDSFYYLDIAENGYRYNGDPSSSPNVVFAPLFPLLSHLVPFAGPVSAGFILNKLLLFLSLVLLFAYLKSAFTGRHAVLILLAMTTAAGSYAWHAYYSESAMLFCLSAALFCAQRNRWEGVTLAAAMLGASRLAALPLVLVLAARLGLEAWRTRQPRLGLYAVLALSGTAGYLGYLGYRFGEPIALLEKIQKVSWGRFHADVDWVDLVDGHYLFAYALRAWDKGVASLIDIKTLNLIWMTLGLASGAYMLTAYRRHLLTWLFVPYVIFIYYASAPSDFLISAHRFMVVVIPIFLMLVDLYGALERRLPRVLAHSFAALMLVLNLVFGLLHTAFFNQGIWFWF